MGGLPPNFMTNMQDNTNQQGQGKREDLLTTLVQSMLGDLTEADVKRVLTNVLGCDVYTDPSDGQSYITEEDGEGYTVEEMNESETNDSSNTSISNSKKKRLKKKNSKKNKKVSVETKDCNKVLRIM